MSKESREAIVALYSKRFRLRTSASPGSTEFAEHNERYCARKGFRVGTTVTLPGPYKSAVVERIYDDIVGGVKLDRELGGFFSWNIADLVKVKSP